MSLRLRRSRSGEMCAAVRSAGAPQPCDRDPRPRRYQRTSGSQPPDVAAPNRAIARSHVRVVAPRWDSAPIDARSGRSRTRLGAGGPAIARTRASPMRGMRGRNRCPQGAGGGVPLGVPHTTGSMCALVDVNPFGPDRTAGSLGQSPLDRMRTPSRLLTLISSSAPTRWRFSPCGGFLPWARRTRSISTMRPSRAM